MAEKTIQRSLRLPLELVREIEKEGQRNERNFSRQVVYMLRLAKNNKRNKEPAHA